jgi:hypothetical protein
MKKLLDLSGYLNNRTQSEKNWNEIARIHEALINGLNEKIEHERFINKEKREKENKK